MIHPFTHIDGEKLGATVGAGALVGPFARLRPGAQLGAEIREVVGLGADVHVGSNCVLVAPVTLGDGATIGGGSTITKDVPAGQLAVARGRQAAISGWSRPVKAKK